VALNATVVTCTQPGATGNQTYSLASNFDPKAIIVLAQPRAAAGIQSHLVMSMGYGTYRGAVVQQMWTEQQSEDLGAAQDTFGRTSNDAVAKLTNGMDNTQDMVVSLVSMQTGATSQFVLNWSNLHTTASVKLTVLVLGGSDITDAMAGLFTAQTTPATQDVTVVSGFGQPDCLFAMHGGDLTTVTTLGGQSPYGTGFATKAAAGGRMVYQQGTDGAATQDVRTSIRNATLFYGGVSGTIQNNGALAAAAGWPTDGFRVTWTTQTAAMPFAYLALKLAAGATVTVGQDAVPASGTQTLTPSSGVAKAAVFLGQRSTVANTDVTSGANNGMTTYGVFASDGTQACVTVWDSDDQSTAAITNVAYGPSKAMQYYLPTTRGLTAETAASVSGGSVVLDWTDPDSSAWLYEWLILSETPPNTDVNAGNVAYTVTAQGAQIGVSSQEAAVALLMASPDSDAVVSVGPSPAQAPITGPAADASVTTTTLAGQADTTLAGLDASAGLAPAITQTATTVVAQDATASAVDLPTPAVVLDIGSARSNKYKLQTCIDGSGVASEYTMADIDAGLQIANFLTVADGTAGPVVEYRIRADAQPTSGATTGRTELREMESDGTTQTAFDAMTGTHEFEVWTSIVHVPAADPEVVVMQLHNGSNDRISVRTQLISGATKLLVRINGTSAIRFEENYVQGTWFKVKARVSSAGAVDIYYNDAYSVSGQLVTTGSASWYFKSGAYAQFDTASAGSSTEYAQVRQYGLVTTHTLATEAAPVTGTGSYAGLDAAVAIAIPADTAVPTMDGEPADISASVARDAAQADATAAALDIQGSVGPTPDTAGGVYTAPTPDPSTSESATPDAATLSPAAQDTTSAVAGTTDPALLTLAGADADTAQSPTADTALAGIVTQDTTSAVAPTGDTALGSVAPVDPSGAIAPGGTTEAGTVIDGGSPSPGISPAGVDVAALAAPAQDADITRTSNPGAAQADLSIATQDAQPAVAPVATQADAAPVGVDGSAAIAVNVDDIPVLIEGGPAVGAGANQSYAQPDNAEILAEAVDAAPSVAPTPDQADVTVVASPTTSTVTTDATTTTPVALVALDGADAVAQRQDTAQAPAETAPLDVSVSADARGGQGATSETAGLAVAGLDTDTERLNTVDAAPALLAPDARAPDQSVTPNVVPVLLSLDAVPAIAGLSQRPTADQADLSVSAQPISVESTTQALPISAVGAAVAGDPAAGVAVGPDTGTVGGTAPAPAPGVGATVSGVPATVDMNATPGDPPDAHASVGATPVAPAVTTHTAQDGTGTAVGAASVAPDPAETSTAGQAPSPAVAPSAGTAAGTVTGAPAAPSVAPTSDGSGLTVDGETASGSATTAAGSASVTVTGLTPSLFYTGSRDVEPAAIETPISTNPANLRISPKALPETAELSVEGGVYAPGVTGTSTPNPAGATVTADGSAAAVTPSDVGAATGSVDGETPEVTALAVAQPSPDPAGVGVTVWMPDLTVSTLAITAGSSVDGLAVIAGRARDAAADVAAAAVAALGTGVAVSPFAIHVATMIAVADALVRVPAMRGSAQEFVPGGATLSETWRVHESAHESMPGGATLSETWRVHGPMGETVRAALIEWLRSTGSIVENGEGR